MSLTIINELIHTFHETIPNILRHIQTLQQTVIAGTIQIETIHDIVSTTITTIIDDDANTETKVNCDVMDNHIHKLFLKYYNMIIEMKEPIKRKDTSDDESNEFISKQEYNVKWMIMTSMMERLMHYLYKKDMITSDMIWINIVKQILLKNTEMKRKIKIIILSRLLISFGLKFIHQNTDKSIIMKIRDLLSVFIIGFVSTNYKNHNEYNDLHTLKDIETVFELIQHIDKDNETNENNKRNKKRKRKKRKKTRTPNHTLISKEIQKYYNESRVNGKERQHKDEIMSHIGDLWKKVLFSSLSSLKSQIHYKSFDGGKYVHLFGSSATKLDEKGSDIDLYLTTPINISHSGQWQLFEELSKELNNNNGLKLNVTNIFHCTVPIIKISDEINNIFVDISFGKSKENEKIVELLNVLCDYNGDKRIRSLIIAIKYWAKRRNLIDAKKNKLSSFGFVLLVIRYLQSQNDYDNKRILPMLRKTKNVNHTMCNDVELVDDVNIKQNHNKNIKKMSLSHLLNGFFQFYSDFDYVHQSISLFKQKVIKNNRRYRDLNGYKMKRDKCCFVIEDPIQTNYNCSKNVRPFSANLMKIEFMRSKLLLRYCNVYFNDLCSSLI